MSMAYEEYMKQIVKPMREELTNAHFQELTSEEAVVDFMENVNGKTLVVINSVCGCAAGLARPAAIHAVASSEIKPTNLVTVFAGQDKEATGKMRSYIKGYEPSSPSMALFKENELVHFIPREDIEDHDIDTIVQNLNEAFKKYFS
ncbi:BrxA/BrxB family bacilliredoxin [Bacillus sp. FJAT-49711]|uniref:BrxA/BrxB family bacilliredoxin n=1 Tax=Bacillus sp. FJAT-49711 TaxID=2833585 RepID=UPI001BC9CDBB|nr:BrxA/BrxB family bacilliredoxin [Bacillus sp. FJAT-49711]MBS4217372.1 BrxA/BrxB family bacilliredoxin [Bacillus sp. FJAT-49711]